MPQPDGVTHLAQLVFLGNLVYSMLKEIKKNKDLDEWNI